MPRGRPRTRVDSTTERVIRIMMDIRPKLPGHFTDPEPDIPLPSALVKAPIFASVLTQQVEDLGIKLSVESKGPMIGAKEERAVGVSVQHEADIRSLTMSSPVAPVDLEPRNKPFICFYCGFQCESHLMRHRCVPKKKRRTLSFDFENFDPQHPATTMRSSFNLPDDRVAESEAAEILSIMLQGA